MFNIFPFFYENHWVLIFCRWYKGELFFSYADSNEGSSHTFGKNPSDLIPMRVKYFFADSPLWPLGTTAHWVYVPTILQSENECGTRMFLHTYLLCVSTVPYLSLLPLFKIPNVKKLNQQCHKWVNTLVTGKKLIVPDDFKNLVPTTDEEPYDCTWAENNCFFYTFNEKQYLQLHTDVRADDVENAHGVIAMDEEIPITTSGSI